MNITVPNQSSISNTASQSLVATAYLWVFRTVLPACVLLGVPNNILTCILFYRNACGVSQTARIYYSAIAVCDTVVLLDQELTQFLGLSVPQLNGAAWLPQGNDSLCRAVRYIWIVSECTSNWILVTFCIERLYAITCPLRSKPYITARRAIIAVFACFLVSGGLLGYCYTIYAVAFLQGTYNCTIALTSSIVSILNNVGTALITTIPTVIEAVCNLVMITIISMAAWKRTALRKSTSDGRLPLKEIQATMTLIAISTYHLAVYIPVIVFSNAMLTGQISVSAAVPGIQFVLVFAASLRCTNFFFYVGRIPAFRTALCNLVCGQQRR
jgi:hypothetical protein